MATQRSRRDTRVTFKESLIGECSSKEWISNKIKGAEFNYWLILQVITITREDYPEFFKEKEGVDEWVEGILYVVAPSQLSRKARKSVAYIYGDSSTWKSMSDEQKVCDCFESGFSAPVWRANKGNHLEVMVEAVKFAQEVEFLFGFLLDREINQVGTTGWMAIKGELLEHLYANKAA